MAPEKLQTTMPRSGVSPFLSKKTTQGNTRGMSARQISCLPDIQGRKRLHQIIERFQLRQEWFQLIQWQGARAIAAGIVRVRMRFQEQAGDTDSQAGAGQVGDLLAAAARRCTTRVTLLQGVRHVEN